jgi:hypothetical protein
VVSRERGWEATRYVWDAVANVRDNDREGMLIGSFWMPSKRSLWFHGGGGEGNGGFRVDERLPPYLKCEYSC